MIWSCNWLIDGSIFTTVKSTSSSLSRLRERAGVRARACTGRVALLTLLALLTACAPLPITPPNETTAPASPASPQQGWRILFDQRLGNCAACHSIPNEQGKKTGIQSTFAPALDGVASRYSAAQLRQWVVDARKINPDTMMPPFGPMLTPQQVTDVLAALQTLR
jgi:L-cysteine S-thiosulfotransferase